MVTFSRDLSSSSLEPTDTELDLISIGDSVARARLIGLWDPTICAMAWRYSRQSHDREDLEQVGRVAVYKAALKFNRSVAIPFEHYAKRAIKNQILKEAKRLAGQRTHEDKSADVSAACKTLISQSRHATRIFWWLYDGHTEYAALFQFLYVDRLSQRELAVVLGVSQARVAQLHRVFLTAAKLALND